MLSNVGDCSNFWNVRGLPMEYPRLIIVSPEACTNVSLFGKIPIKSAIAELYERTSPIPMKHLKTIPFHLYQSIAVQIEIYGSTYF